MGRMGRQPQSKGKGTRATVAHWRAKLLRGLGYVFALSLLLLLDNAVESIGGADHLSIEQRYSKIFSPSALYPVLTGAGSRTGSGSHTAVIVIGTGALNNEADDPCLIRRLIAHVVKGAQDLRPSVIAIDRSFNATGCTSEVSNSLLASEVASSQIPIALGQATQSFDELQTKRPLVFQKLATHGLSDSDLYVADPIPFETTQQRRLAIGLMRLDADNRKIPLSWHVKRPDGSYEWLDSLSAASVRLAEAGKQVQTRVAHLKENHRNPLSSFYRENQLLLIDAMDVICGNNATASSWTACTNRSSSNVQLTKLQGRVLLIGIVDRNGQEDVQESPVGKVSGVILQANYIEALLANSFLSAVSPVSQIAIGIAWFCIVEIILRACKGSITRSIVLPVASITALWIVISIALLYFRVYVELLFPSILVIIVAHISKRVEATISRNGG